MRLALGLILISMSLLGAADPALQKRGALIFIQCRACHAIDGDSGAKVGPSLLGVIGAKAASRTDFGYSSALKNASIVWTEPELDRWLKNPAERVPGTSMIYPGLNAAADRAAVIAYLRGIGR
jgi:cytochrome c